MTYNKNLWSAKFGQKNILIGKKHLIGKSFGPKKIFGWKKSFSEKQKFGTKFHLLEYKFWNENIYWSPKKFYCQAQPQLNSTQLQLQPQ